MSKGLFTASNIKYPAAYLSCFYINSIKMHQGWISAPPSLPSSVYLCPSSSLLLDMLHNCLLVRLISNPPCDVFAGPWLFSQFHALGAYSLSHWISSRAGFITLFTEKDLWWKDGNLASKAEMRVCLDVILATNNTLCMDAIANMNHKRLCLTSLPIH